MNCIEYASVFFGILSIGGVVVAINPSAQPSEILHQLKDSQAKFAITSSPFLETVKNATKKVKSIQEIFTFDQVQGFSSFSSLIKNIGKVFLFEKNFFITFFFSKFLIATTSKY